MRLKAVAVFLTVHHAHECCRPELYAEPRTPCLSQSGSQHHEPLKGIQTIFVGYVYQIHVAGR